MVGSNLFQGYSEHYNEELRLCLLKAVDEDPGKSVNDSLLHRVVGDYGFNCTRDHLRTQLLWLQNQGSAVSLREVGTAVIAQLAQAGEDHLQRRALIVGVKPPSLPR